MSSVLDLVDAVVNDLVGVGPELAQITAILNTDVNITDINANIQARCNSSVISMFGRTDHGVATQNTKADSVTIHARSACQPCVTNKHPLFLTTCLRFCMAVYT